MEQKRRNLFEEEFDYLMKQKVQLIRKRDEDDSMLNNDLAEMPGRNPRASYLDSNRAGSNSSSGGQ